MVNFKKLLQELRILTASAVKRDEKTTVLKKQAEQAKEQEEISMLRIKAQKLISTLPEKLKNEARKGLSHYTFFSPEYEYHKTNPSFEYNDKNLKILKDELQKQNVEFKEKVVLFKEVTFVEKDSNLANESIGIKLSIHW